MMLTGRNEMIAIGLLILYVAFVPCPYAMKEFFASSVGKVLALSAVIYVWKYVSEPVSLLVLVAFLRSGAIREFADDPSMVPAMSGESEFKCPSDFVYDTTAKQCKKGAEMRVPECTDTTKTWSVDSGMCVAMPDSAPPTTMGSGAGGPPGGSTGAAAAMAALDAEMPPGTTEKFTPYGGVDAGFSPV